jgi:hypothetical protein
MTFTSAWPHAQKSAACLGSSGCAPGSRHRRRGRRRLRRLTRFPVLPVLKDNSLVRKYHAYGCLVKLVEKRLSQLEGVASDFLLATRRMRVNEPYDCAKLGTFGIDENGGCDRYSGVNFTTKGGTVFEKLSNLVRWTDIAFLQAEVYVGPQCPKPVLVHKL